MSCVALKKCKTNTSDIMTHLVILIYITKHHNYDVYCNKTIGIKLLGKSPTTTRFMILLPQNYLNSQLFNTFKPLLCTSTVNMKLADCVLWI